MAYFFFTRRFKYPICERSLEKILMSSVKCMRKGCLRNNSKSTCVNIIIYEINAETVCTYQVFLYKNDLRK